MSARPETPWCRLASVGALAALTSCSSAPTRLYNLSEVVTGGTALDYAGPPVRIDAVHVPPALDRIEQVIETAPGEQRIMDLDQWSAPLGEAARQALSADLVVRLPGGKVIFPHLAKPPGALGVDVDILDVSAHGDEATMLASWSLHPSAWSGGTVVLDTREAGAGQGGAAMARAISQMLAQLADRIDAGLPRTAPMPR